MDSISFEEEKNRQRVLKNTIQKILLAFVTAVIATSVDLLFAFLLTTMGSINWYIAILLALPEVVSVVLVLYVMLWVRHLNIGVASVKSDNKPDKQNAPMSEFEQTGIVGSTPGLSETRFEPQECMKIISNRMWFMGVLGTKWVTAPGTKAEFEDFVKKIELAGGNVRFLLINPKSDSFMKLKSVQGHEIGTDSLDSFRELMSKYPKTLEVRLYDHLPFFRLVFLDGSTLALSTYKFDKTGILESKYGWKSPQLIVKLDSYWSIGKAFELYYQEEWSRAHVLKTVRTPTSS